MGWVVPLASLLRSQHHLTHVTEGGSGFAMNVIPSTAYGLAVLLALVIPGAVYTSVRTAVGGRSPHDGELGTRVLRAILASAILDSAYLVIFGNAVVAPFAEGIDSRPRQAGAVGIGLGIALPWPSCSTASRGGESWLSADGRFHGQGHRRDTKRRRRLGTGPRNGMAAHGYV